MLGRRHVAALDLVAAQRVAGSALHRVPRQLDRIGIARGFFIPALRGPPDRGFRRDDQLRAFASLADRETRLIEIVPFAIAITAVSILLFKYLLRLPIPVHLPGIGIRGNTHFPFSDLNNLEIADLMSRFLSDKGLD